nr:unnamed protein product [Spirometra erinaceieuropaei]
MLLKNGLVLAVFDLLKLAKISCFYGLKFLSDRCLPKENVPTNGSSDEENQVAFDKSFVEKDKALQVELTPIFSPRRFRSPSKDQAAKLKRVNARRIEFDVEEVVENSDLSSSYAHEESFLSQSIVGDPKEKLLELCGQTETRSFSSFFDAETLESIVKIGEGVYGEVFQTHKGTVIKVFPVDGDLPVNGEKQMESSRVYPEVFISR